MNFLGDDWFLYKGHVLKAKQGEWGAVDAMSEFDKKFGNYVLKHGNQDDCPRCHALTNRAKKCPYCGYERDNNE